MQFGLDDDAGQHYYGFVSGSGYTCLGEQPGDNPWVPSGCYDVSTWGLFHALFEGSNACDIHTNTVGCSNNDGNGNQLIDWRDEIHRNFSPFGSNLSLQVGPTPPDLPLVSNDPRVASSVLIPPAWGFSTRPVARYDRPTLGGIVDLVTGIPTIQEVDVKLPFGSAVYRHVRTYSEPPPGYHEVGCYGNYIDGAGGDYEGVSDLRVDWGRSAGDSGGDYWDWHGQGWMIGESPVLLIDAHYDRAVAVRQTDGTLTPRRCYFVLDSFTTIPFIQDPSSPHGDYVAPSQFDAFLDHNGVWDGDHWDTRPTEFRVWLFDRSVCYTIRPVYQDVAPGTDIPAEYSGDCPVTDHDSPTFVQTGGGYLGEGANGVPYLGLTERIDDRYGNCIDLVYSSFSADACPGGPVEGCDRCCQNCNEKGQIAFARLIAGASYDVTFDWASSPVSQFDWTDADDGDVAWTLVYTYRSFGARRYDLTAHAPLTLPYEFHHQTAINSIHVYEGALPNTDLFDTGGAPINRTIHFDQFWRSTLGEAALDGIDALLPSQGVPSTWVHELRYVYAEPTPNVGSLDYCDADELHGYGINTATEYYAETFAFSCPDPTDQPRLIKVTHTTVDPADSSEPAVATSLYQYDALGYHVAADRTSTERNYWRYITTLRSIYHDATIKAALNELNADGTGPTWTVNSLITGFADDGGAAEYLDQTDPPLTFSFDDIPDDAEYSCQTASSSWSRIADLSLYEWSSKDIAADECFGALADFPDRAGGASFSSDLFDNYIEKDPDQAQHIATGSFVIADRGWSGSGLRYYKLYRFHHFGYEGAYDFMTRDSGDICWPWNGTWVERAIYRHPYRRIIPNKAVDVYTPPVDGVYSGDSNTGNTMQTPWWITVVDEYGEFDDMRVVASVPDGKTPGGEWGVGQTVLPSSRRLLEMNGAGYVLFDKHWNLEDGSSYADGVRDEFEYDSDGRLTEHRTIGWGATPEADQADEGLVVRYTYRANYDQNGDGDADDIEDIAHEIASRSIRRGSGLGGELLLERYSYDLPDRPDLPTASLIVLDPATEQGYTTTYNYDFLTDIDGDSADEPYAEDWLIARRQILGPVVKVGIGETAGDYRPQQTQFMETAKEGRGRLVWKSYGLEPVGGGDESYATRYFDYSHYDSYGRMTRQVVDAEAGAQLGNIMRLAADDPWEYESSPGVVPPYPEINADGTGDERLPTGGQALHEVTKRAFRSKGVAVEERPGGKQTWYGYRRADGKDFTYVMDFVATNPGVPVNPGKVIITDGPRPSETLSVKWEAYNPAFEIYTATYSPITTVEVGYDSAGRPTAASATGFDGKSVSVESKLDSFGSMSRERDPTGTLTRTYSNPLGLPERVFRGTRDYHSFWGYPTDDSDPYADDLILTEQHEYGSGSTNVYQLIRTRHFDFRPTGQYTQSEWPNTGWTEEHDYDWRLREVWTGTFAEGADNVLLRQRFSLLDHQGRVRFLAEYGPEGPDRPIPPGSAGAGDFTIGGFTVDGDAAFATDLGQAIVSEAHDGQHSYDLLSLVETLYDDAGRINEVRDYDVRDSSGTRYLATITHYDYQGNPLLTVSPDAGAVRVHYDAKGRETSRSTVTDAGATDPFEVNKTVTEYTSDGKPKVVTTWERLHDHQAPTDGSVLDTTNALRTQNWSWYDPTGKLVATADLGSGGPPTGAPTSDEFTNADGFPAYDSDAPSVESNGDVDRNGCPEWAVLTCYMYDSAGRQALTASQIAYDPTVGSHAYRVDRQYFDGLGNLVFKDENATAASDADDRAQTAYLYEDKRLIKIAAVLPEHHSQLLQVAGVGGCLQGSGSAAGEQLPGGYPQPIWNAVNGSLQVTLVDYDGDDGPDGDSDPDGAEVYAGDGALVSHTFAWPARVFLPDESTGQPDPSGPADLIFTYNIDGTIRTRTDRLGRVFTHTYDQHGQRTQTDIEYPAYAVGYETYRPNDLADFLTYSYDTEGNMLQATAWGPDGDDPDSDPDIIAQNQGDYDELNRLVTEWQSYGVEVDTDDQDGTVSPRITYNWEYSAFDGAATSEDGGITPSGHNFNRLRSMTYPPREQTGLRTIITLAHGEDFDSLDSAMARVSGIREEIDGQTTRKVGYEYLGTGRRVATTLWGRPGGGALAEIMTQSFGFDDGQSLGYPGLDRFGRTKDLHFRDAATNETIHRYQYGYSSAGDRLYARVTQRDPSDSSQIAENQRSWLYQYDAMSRLVGTEFGSLVSTNDAISHSTGDPIARRVAWGLDRLGNWGEVSPVEDGSGGLPGRVEREWDDITGAYDTILGAKLHDTDSRNQIDSILETAAGGSAGPQKMFVYDDYGNMVSDGVYWYQYDAFNRVASVHELGSLGFDASGAPASGVPGDWRLHYTYDAIGRLICKQVPWNATTERRVAFYHYDGVRRIQEVFKDPVLGSIAPIGTTPTGGGGTSYTTYTDREYVYGPDYLDEVLWQTDKVGASTYLLQDAGYDVVAVLAEGPGGTDGGGSPFPAAAILQQVAYDPYGQTVALDIHASSAITRFGYHGLPCDRLDGVAAAQALELGGKSLYHNRNRSYSAVLGRYVTSDPHATGALTLVGDSRGQAISWLSQIGSVDILGVYSDGLNRYGALASSPVTHSDPHGLFVDDVVDVYATVGITAGEIAYLLTSEYAANMESDALWASDWDLPDDFHTRLDASWIDGVYEQVNIQGAVDGFLNPFAMGGVGSYVDGSRVLRTVVWQGRRVLRGAGHHAFFRILTRFRSGAKEVIVRLPSHLHRRYHTFVDRRVRQLVGRECPSIWDPRGAPHWKKWIDANPGILDDYINGLKKATGEFEKLTGVRGLVQAIEAALS